MHIALTCHRAAAAAVVAASLAACQTVSTANDPDSRRAAIRAHADETMTRLYAEYPKSREQVAAAVGYAVFDLSSVNAVLLVGQSGKGMLVDGKTRIPTYMKAMRAGTGPGIGYQELRQVFIFSNATSMHQFLMGESGGGDVSASATVGTANVQQSFNPGINTYQLTDRGFAVQANWGGTVYVADTELACTPAPCPALP